MSQEGSARTTRQGNGMLAGFAARYMALIEWFIPESMRGDREASNRARMFLISHSMGPILGNSVPLTVLLASSTLRLDAMVLVASVTAFWVFPFLLKRGVRYEALVLTSVVNLNFVILASCYFYGGVSSPTLPWLLIIPILSLFYIGGDRRLQPHLLSISGVSFALFLVLYDLVPPPPMDMPGYVFTGLGIVSTAAALSYVATMAIYYARIFDASIALEIEVHRRREKMDELREAVAVSDRAAATKSEFLARMSHELRTPLNAVIGYSQLLREEAIEANDPHMREDVERIHEAGTYLLRLVNMILDLSKLEARRIQFNVLQHEVGSIAQRAAAAKRELVGDRGNLVCFDLDAGLGPVFVDANRLQQVLEALVENAAQHTSAGTITVRTRAAVLGDDRAFAVSVEDTGAGIEAAVLPDLFRTFSTPRDAASASRYGGTGLNLTVVHHMCRAMGGGVEVESERGKGTVFTVTLPYDGRRVVRQRSEQRRAA